jgi:hypothetical protein
MVATEVSHPVEHERVEDAIDRWVAGLPWGVAIFGLVVVLGLWWVADGRLEPAQFLQAIAAGSGLLAIGHGIRRRGN